MSELIPDVSYIIVGSKDRLSQIKSYQIEDGTGVIKYALCEENCECEVGNDLHLHFHCNNCNETVCLTEHKIPHINLPDGYITEDINLVVKGICEKCSDNLD